MCAEHTSVTLDMEPDNRQANTLPTDVKPKVSSMVIRSSLWEPNQNPSPQRDIRDVFCKALILPASVLGSCGTVEVTHVMVLIFYQEGNF